MSQESNQPADRDERLEKLELALESAQAKLADQSARLDALGSGREDSMRLLSDAQAELVRVTAERDQLQKRLVAIEGMQTETIALPDDQDVGLDTHAALPSIDELMSRLNLMSEESQVQGRSGRPSGQAAECPDTEWDEMIPPEVIAPKEFGGQAQPGGASANAQTLQLVVYMDSEHPVEYPLHKEVMTIGRSESADIRIDAEYISRIHARIVCGEDGTVIEDAGSKNGFQINSEAVKRHNLTHGDVIRIGQLRFTFVDTAHQS